MDMDLVWKIVLAVGCPVLASALSFAFYVSQTKWEQRRNQRWWQDRKSEWIDCDQASYEAKLKGLL